MIYKYVLLAFLLSSAVYSDIRHYKIKNLHLALGLAAGIAVNCVTSGLKELPGSIAAALLPAAILLPLFALRMLGAGDIKLLSVIGAIMGMEFILYASAFSFIAGGVMAILIMLARRNFVARLKHISDYLKAVYLSRSFLPYTDFSVKSDGAKFHFSVAITAGCCIQTILSGLL